MRANKNSKASLAKKTVFGIAVSLAVIAFFALMTVAGIVIYINSDVDLDPQALVFANTVPDVYDVNGDLTSYCTASEICTDYSVVPEHLKNAFIALEDKRFYEHHGVDYVRIAGAALANVKSGRRAQGGSTITQQIVKNAFLSNEKSFSRKLKEARMAVSLERRLSKDEILETYFNMLYFGSGEYGVKNAARRFFGCDVEDLTIAQSAMLAGIVKSPTKYNPVNNYENALKRSALVLSLMRDQGKISDEEYKAASAEKIVIADDKSALDFDKTYVTNALSEACRILGTDEKSLRAGGYSLFTYLDPERQKTLGSIVGDEAYASYENTLCAAIDCDVSTGGIRALRSDFSADFYNFRRQSGSVLKPLVCYAPAFENGLLSPASVLEDAPTDFGGYSPQNYGGKYYGSISVRDAFAYSLNVPAVATLRSVGVQCGYFALKEMGFALADDDNLSLALGSTLNGCSFLELLGGYLTLTGGGKYTGAHFIRYIRDADGNVVYTRENDAGKQVFSKETAYLTTNCMQACAKYGTAKKLSQLRFDVASKTGTVESAGGNADAYNVSFTGDDCLLFWMGSKRYDFPMSSKVTGGGIPTLMCKNYLEKIYSCRSPRPFGKPAGIVDIRLDKIAYENGLLVRASENSPEKFVKEDVFNASFAPVEQDKSFDFPQATSFNAETEGNKLTITFTADPHLNYKIVKKSLFTDDKIILDIKNESGEITVSDNADGLLGYNRYVLVPYYYDDENRETIGEIYQVPVGW